MQRAKEAEIKRREKDYQRLQFISRAVDQLATLNSRVRLNAASR